MPSQHASSLRGLACLTLAILTALPLLSGAALSAQPFAGTLISCPFLGTGSTSTFNGFYVTAYPGNNLSLVTLGYTSAAAEPYGISLSAHRNSFDGPMIGTTQTAVVTVPTSGEVLVTFDFGAAPVTPGDTIAFTQDFVIYGPIGSQVFYDTGTGKCNSVFATNGTAPPLGSAAPWSVGLSITQKDLGGRFCIPSDTALCLDGGVPGDPRFRVTATFHTVQDGGVSGNAQAMPLAQLGATHGGVLWFFSADNPELLVKLVNGCSINDHFWAYISATTNVGFSVTVTDTSLANVTKTYTNPDLTPAQPIQDGFALASCHACTSDAQCPAGLLCCFHTGGTLCLPPAAGGVCPAIP
jgi:hypothetical protein